MSGILEQHAWSAAPGPWHEGPEALPDGPLADPPARVLAYYLPQFHADPVNDAAWGKGFTEWTNVTKALPRVSGQVQPRLPADLGFYDLGRPETIAAQAELARRAGIWGFCIHDYWFSGTKVLSKPLRTILDHPEIDLRFCLNWANENWTRRWDGSEHEVILAQKHAPGDAEAYIDSIAPALRDPRYVRVGDRPLLMIYRPGRLPDAADLVARWRARAREIGVGELYVVMPQAFGETDPVGYGMDAAAGFPPHHSGWPQRIDARRLRRLDPAFSGRVYDYDRMAAHALADRPEGYRLLPGVCPSWDNEARRTAKGAWFHGATPPKYGAWLRGALRRALEAPEAERIVFANAWNEWAEGAVLEPDRHHGHAWLAETRRALEAVAADPEGRNEGPWPQDDRTPPARRLHAGPRHYLVNRARGLMRRVKRG